MKVQELIDLLSDMNPDSEVRLAQQPAWPFEYSIGEVIPVTIRDDEPDIVYIAEHEQLGYLPETVATALNWSL